MISLLDEINKTRAEHVLTIEDPVEYIFQDNKSIFSQREI
jgi:twitching motility protein PilT